MAVIQTLNSKAIVKKSSANDLPFNAQQPVISSYYATSTASQTVINLTFSVQTTGVYANTDNFWLMVDGKKLTLGTASTNDYYFSNVGPDGSSSQVTLNQALVAGLNIQAYKMGLKRESEFQTDNRFTALYEYLGDGFQGFINPNEAVLTATTTTGTPAAGTFYSSITGRAPLMDFSQDLRARMGVERIAVQSIYQLQNEFGPNGEPVWGVLNDTLGQVRFVGNWANGSLISTYGQYIQTGSSNTTDYIEVTFYGTGLSLLSINANSAGVAVSVDGGAETTVSTLTGGSSVIGARNYSTNQVISLVSGLTAGVHTVKVRGTGQLLVYGFEILNVATTPTNVLVNPGVGYNQGKRVVTSAQAAFAYNSVATGTRGGRIVVYQGSDGTIGQAWQAVNASQANLTNADHTNEEVVRTYYPREFGAGRSDDFSIGGPTGTNRAFTLDDGTTTLVGQNVGLDPFLAGSPQVVWAVASSPTVVYFTLTFVGTGLDILAVNDGTTRVVTVSVDGASVGNITMTSTGIQTVHKIVSGLPYGTHTVKFANQGNTTSTFGVIKFITYQPKKPSVPSGAIELADYNVMANYAAGSLVTPSAGALMKSCAREFIYTGTWTGPTLSITANAGFGVTSSTAGQTWSYTFFGTGFEQLIGSAAATTLTLQVDGANYAGSVTAAPSANFSYSSPTITFSAGITTLVQISGLTLGWHTVKFTTGGAVALSVYEGYVITPMHSVKSNLYADIQNTLPVGSNSISDNRKLTPVKEVLPATKAWVQAVALTTNPTTTSTTAIPLPDMSCTIKTLGGAIEVSFSTCFLMSTTGGTATCQLFVDGVSAATIPGAYPASVSANGFAAGILKVPVAAGVHKVDIYWFVTPGNTGTAGVRILSVKEL
jgi:hypothetical protein